MPRSKKFSNNFVGKTIHTFWGYFIFVCQAIQKCIVVFAVYEVSELEHTINSLFYCAARLTLAKVCPSPFFLAAI